MTSSSQRARSPRKGLALVDTLPGQPILLLRGERVILDSDLARLYGVPTKRLNEQVRRNRLRFPPEFVFRLNRREKAKVVAECDHLARLKFSPGLPNAFTEHGAIMAANVLNSDRAVRMSVLLVRAFIRLRAMVISHADLARRLDEMEHKYDAQFRAVFEALRALMDPPTPVPGARRPIGFRRAVAAGDD